MVLYTLESISESVRVTTSRGITHTPTQNSTFLVVLYFHTPYKANFKNFFQFFLFSFVLSDLPETPLTDAPVTLMLLPRFEGRLSFSKV